MKSKQIKAMKPEEAKSKLHELYKEMVKLRTQIRSGTSIKNPSQVKNNRKNIARLLQNLNQNKEV
jgi:ribosomal protein L29